MVLNPETRREKEALSRRKFHAPVLKDINNDQERFGLEFVSALNKYEHALVFANRFPPNEARYATAVFVEATFEAVRLASETDTVPRLELVGRIEDFCLQAVNEEYWYTYGDIFSFGEKHLEELLERPDARPIGDPGHFAEYLRRFPGAHGRDGYRFWFKFYVVLGVLCSTSRGVYHAFQLLAYLKSDLFISERRMRKMDRKDAFISAAITRQMQNLFNGNIARTPNEGASIRTLQCELPQFWNCASTRRKLRRWDTYLEAMSKGVSISLRQAPFIVHVESRVESVPSTYECDNRRREFELLEVLQKRAWSEIRFNVHLICASRLPTELVEIVFEHALESEEIPLDPRMSLNSMKP